MNPPRGDHVPLRDFVERIIVDNNVMRDNLRADDRRWFERELTALSKALELQAKEYERRLFDLNHSHEIAKEALATYITRELYERSHTEVVEWQRKADVISVETNNRIKSVELGLVNLPGGIKSLELGLASQSAQKIGSAMTRSTAITLVSVIIAAVSFLVALTNYLYK